MSIFSSKYRIHFPGAIYHVINRGNNKGDIFIDEKDYNVFLKHLREVKEEKDFFLYCYCLMPNHFHLLLEVKDEPLSKIMQSLLTSYVIYFNSRYERSGHLFQSRYKAVICDKEEYLFKLVRYIHLNPKRAHLVEDISKYKWSSHNNYSGKWDNKVLSTEKLFTRMGETLSSGYRVYNNLVKDENDKLQEGFKGSYKNFSLSEILENISLETKISKEVIMSGAQSKEVNRARKIFSYNAVKEQGYTVKEAADFIKREYSGVAKYIREIEKKGTLNPKPSILRTVLKMEGFEG